MRIRPLSLLALALLAASPPWLPAPREQGGAVEEPADPVWQVPRGTLVLRGDPEAILIEGATIFTSAGPRIEVGWVLLEGRKVAGVGASDYSGTLPTGALRVDGTGRFVTPGLIDVHTHMGVYAAPGAPAHSDGNEMVNPVTAGVEAIHAFWPQDPAIERAVAGGVTTVQVLPGSGNLIGGHGATLKLHPRMTPQEMRFPGAPDGIKMACGENPKRVYGDRGGPQTRMGNIYRDRKAWIEATEYARRWQDWEDGGQSGPPPGRDLAKETLAGILSGDLLAQIHCYRADDILHMLGLAEEFGWQVRLFHHAIEAYKVRDKLAAAGTGMAIWADWWGFKYEAYDATMAGPALAHLDGVKVTIHSDSATGIQRLNHHVSMIYHEGLDKGLPLKEEDAIEWVTINPAWGLGVQESTGSLEPGKMADLVLWSHHPLSVLARADLTVIDGEIMWDRAAGLSVWSDFEAGQWPTDAEATS